VQVWGLLEAAVSLLYRVQQWGLALMWLQYLTLTTWLLHRMSTRLLAASCRLLPLTVHEGWQQSGNAVRMLSIVICA
jgi:hypothetical protein